VIKPYMYEMIASSENSNWTMTQKIKKRESLETATEQKNNFKISENYQKSLKLHVCS
jgi:hypothetical protein